MHSEPANYTPFIPHFKNSNTRVSNARNVGTIGRFGSFFLTRSHIHLFSFSVSPRLVLRLRGGVRVSGVDCNNVYSFLLLLPYKTTHKTPNLGSCSISSLAQNLDVPELCDLCLDVTSSLVLTHLTLLLCGARLVLIQNHTSAPRTPRVRSSIMQVFESCSPCIASML